MIVLHIAHATARHGMKPTMIYDIFWRIMIIEAAASGDLGLASSALDSSWLSTAVNLRAQKLHHSAQPWHRHRR
jgi:hypothetical protein